MTFQSPKQSSYDVVIVGGAMYGSSVAWFLTDNPGFDGSILVVEMDPTYEFTATQGDVSSSSSASGGCFVPSLSAGFSSVSSAADLFV